VVPGFDLAYGSSDMHVALEMTGASVGVIVGFVAFARYRQDRRFGDLAVAVAVGFVLPVAGVGLMAVPTVLDYAQIDSFSVWSSLAALLVAAGTLALGGLISGRVVGEPTRVAVVAYGIAAALVAVPAAFVHHFAAQLPLAIDPALSPVGTGRAAFTGDPWVLAGEGAMSALLAVAAVGFLRGLRSDGGPLSVWTVPALATASLAAFNYLIFPSAYSYWVYTGDILTLAVALIFVWGLFGELRAHTQTVIAAAVLDERRRVARDLHDGIAQELAFVSSGLRGLPDELAPQLAWIRSAAERALYESRRAIVALTEPLDQPLATAIMEAVGDVAARSDVKLLVEVEEPSNLAAARREVLVRVTREAVVNAVRHGRPHTVVVYIRRRGGLTLTVRDDGFGFDLLRVDDAGFGLTSMRERVETDGGRFDITSTPGAGTTVSARWAMH
jgi:signal transduction histidine kinase